MKKQRFTTLGILLLLFILAACGGQPEVPTAVPTEPAATEEEMEETAVTNALTVSDQELASGNMVTVSDVTADVDGWMVIHTQADGAPGPVIGHTPVSAGDSSDITVEIDPSSATETIYAMLHIDAGTIGEYEFPGPDSPAMDADGNVVVAPFALTIPNAVSIEDQAIDDANSVTADSVVAAVDGWLVIHAQADGAPGPVLGHVPVSAGYSNDVTVEIDTAGATDTLYAMLHVDEGEIGTYEFPGADVPAMDADGNVVVQPFSAELMQSNALSVADQAVENGAVTVASVTAVVDGWMVIHKADGDSFGAVIGFAPVSAGTTENVVVEIDTAEATDTLYAMLHVDEGEIGTYEFPGADVPAMDADGNVVVQPFSAELMQSNALSVADQAVENGAVTVASVTAVVDGWMVIHKADGDSFGAVIGFAPVSAGTTENVVVEIDTAEATDTLYAMLHVDEGEIGTYEFPGADVPAMDADGNVVVQPFDATGASEAVIIEMQDFVFGQTEITVPAGTTITWRNVGSVPHTATAADGSFDTGTVQSDEEASITVTEPGEYLYYCQFHGSADGEGMVATLIVE